MSDRSWMLNASAIAAAKRCVNLVEEELAIRLRLSNPDFLELLVSYVELTEAEPLRKAVDDLFHYAPPPLRAQWARVMLDQKQRDDLADPVTDPSVEETEAVAMSEATPATESVSSEDQYVNFKGKSYARFLDGREFRGLYRGQPRYA